MRKEERDRKRRDREKVKVEAGALLQLQTYKKPGFLLRLCIKIS